MKFQIFKKIFFIVPALLLADSSISGNINFYSAFKTSDNSLIRLPYRLINLNFQHQKNNIQFKILLILLCITDAKFGSGKAWPYLIVDHQKRRLVHFLQ